MPTYVRPPPGLSTQDFRALYTQSQIIFLPQYCRYHHDYGKTTKTKKRQCPMEKKEPITPAMIIEMATLAASMSPDSDFAAMYDWSALGISTGHR